MVRKLLLERETSFIFDRKRGGMELIWTEIKNNLRKAEENDIFFIFTAV